MVAVHKYRSRRTAGWHVACCIWLGSLLQPAQVAADPAGVIKMLKGSVHIVRDSQTLNPRIGDTVQSSDTLMTAASSAVGVTLFDGTMLSAGADSTLVLNKFSFHDVHQTGELDASIKKGTLAVISGKLAKTSRDAVVFRTPNAILGVRGTAFMIEVGESFTEPAP